MGETEARAVTTVVWFRRDLRVADHPALHAAVERGGAVVALFVADDGLLEAPVRSAARIWFYARTLEVLDQSLRDRGSGLLVRSGRPADVVPAVAREVGADVVLASRDLTPYSHRRDRDVAAALERDGRRLVLEPGIVLVEPEELMTPNGTPYAVFSPFWRALQKAARREVLAAPDRIETPAGLVDRPIELPGSLAPTDAPSPALPEPGEPAALERLAGWAADGVERYRERRDRLIGDSTSRLSQDLHFGLLSPRQVEDAVAGAGEAAVPYVRQLAWRDFYHHALFALRAQPDRVATGPLMAAFRPESDDPEAVAAWREGRTGIPVVDAAMRQLLAEAWMSNRARLVVASFLTRHLLIDYRVGEEHFLRHLIDGDIANNLGGWQWTAGVGADPQPWFRIFNPVLQGRKFDPDGAWVRRWVPELAGLSDRWIHEPWAMPPEEAERAGVRIGETYPAPIVDLRVGRERALAAFRAASDRDDAETV